MGKHSDMVDQKRSKAARYNLAMCDFAIADCHSALASLGATCSTDYSVEKLAEIDACRERSALLLKATMKRPKVRAVEKGQSVILETVDFGSNW